MPRTRPASAALSRLSTTVLKLGGRRADHQLSMVSHRTHAQSMVEFGLIALLFTLLLFGIADFGMLLNGWINVSSGSSAAARQASVGASVDQIHAAVEQFSKVPGLSACSAAAPQPCAKPLKLISTFPGALNYCRGFNASPSSMPYTISVKSTTVTCRPDTELPDPNTGDTIVITVLANTFEVSTPLVRPFFGCTDGTQRHCFVPLSSSTNVRYEGPAV